MPPAATMQEEATSSDDALEQSRVVSDLEAALLEDPDITAEERDTVLRRLRDAMRQTPTQLGAPDIEGLRATFADMVRTMAQQGLISGAEQEPLIRELFGAVDALDSDAVKRAAEFSRLMSSDGEQAATEWLVAQGHPVESDTPAIAQGLNVPSKRAAGPTRRRRR